MCNDELAMNDAIRIKLALNTYSFSRTKDHVCGKMQTVLSDVHDLAETGGVVFRHQTTP